MSNQVARIGVAVPGLTLDAGSVLKYHGPYYDFGGLIVDPFALQQNKPLWIGGRTGLSLRRAVTLGDGWTRRN